MSEQESNPYASPVDTEKGAWDHTLFWRLFKITWAFILFFVILDMVILRFGGIKAPGETIFWAIQDQWQDETIRKKNVKDYQKILQERLTRQADSHKGQ